MQVKLVIVREGGDGVTGVPVCVVPDRRLLVQAARRAIEVRRSEASHLARTHPELLELANEETEQIARLLAMLVPEICEAPALTM